MDVRRKPRLRRAAWLAAAMLLCGFAAWQAVVELPTRYAFDLYHPWGIALARRAGASAANPYIETPRLGAFLLERVQRSSSGALQAAARFWTRRNPGVLLEPTGTPLYYTLFAWLPGDFDAAHAVLDGLLYAALASGIYMLGRARCWTPAQSLCALAVICATFRPFAQDLAYGNVNSVQFAVVAAAIVLAQRKAWERHAWLDRAFLPALAVFVLAKPNTALVVAALAIHYAVTRPARSVRRAALLSGLALASGAGLAAAWFANPRIWSDWHLYTGGLNRGTLLYTASEGNLSLGALMTERAHLPLAVHTVASGVLLCAATWFALTRRGRAPLELMPAVRALVLDPWLLASLGVIATLALAPLLWEHYYVMALVPLLRLLRWPGGTATATVAAAAAYVLMSRPLLDPLFTPGAFALYLFVLRLAWLPLLVALLAQLHAAAARGRDATPDFKAPACDAVG